MSELSHKKEQELAKAYAGVLLGTSTTLESEISEYIVYLASLSQRDLWEGYSDGMESRPMNGSAYLYIEGFKQGREDAGRPECRMGYDDGINGLVPRQATDKYLRCYIIGRKSSVSRGHDR